MNDKVRANSCLIFAVLKNKYLVVSLRKVFNMDVLNVVALHNANPSDVLASAISEEETESCFVLFASWLNLIPRGTLKLNIHLLVNWIVDFNIISSD